VIEAPDDRTVSALLLTLAGTGNVKTTTLRAFDRTEMDGILEKLAGA
jgi:uncharacterized protein with GYD domain